MKASWVLLGLLGLIVLVAIFVGEGYVSAKNQMVSKDRGMCRRQPRTSRWSCSAGPT